MQHIRLRPAASPAGSLWQPTIGDHCDRLGRHLLKDNRLDNDKGFRRVREEAARILAQCLAPGSPAAQRTGLVVGYIQSGKTLSMTTVAALARDNGYRIIIAISGTTENLFRQSSDRFAHDLRATSPVSSHSWVILENPTHNHQGQELAHLVRDWRDNIPDARKRTLFITVMKNHSRLRNLTGLLSSQDLTGIDALILDDEADQAGLNTRPQAADASTTHRRLREIRRSLPKHTYLQYTATAQALFLISLIDMLSPDFADVIEAGDDYCGGKAFFLGRRDLLHTIPDAELPSQVVRAPQPPPSLVHAIQLFALGAAAAAVAGDGPHRSMLIHPDFKTATHNAYEQWVRAITSRWADVLRLPLDDNERRGLAHEFEQPYAELQATAQNLPPLPTLLEELSYIIRSVRVTVVNSHSGQEVLWENAFAHILIGGQKLDRGYTVKGLTVTYMPRGPGTWTADTIQQRARFFGYKRDYLGFCRVFLEANVRALYHQYVEHEENLRTQIIEHRGKPARDLRRLFILDPRYRPTRPNVITETPFRIITGDWFKEKLSYRSGSLAENIALWDGYLASLSLAPHPQFRQHHIATAPLSDAITVLGTYAFDGEEVFAQQALLYHLIAIAEKHPTETACIILMGGQPRVRALRSDDEPSIEIHQGRSSAGADNYPGDAAVRDPNHVTVQIHWVQVFKDTTHTEQLVARAPAVALHIPPAFGSLSWLAQTKAGQR